MWWQDISLRVRAAHGLEYICAAPIPTLSLPLKGRGQLRNSPLFDPTKINMPNRLQNETSPYLQQHADNPVDWYAWNEEALTRARNENKPILLSIGYSACHWCHVMAHESFEDAETARVMNELFINIKVDREERPDLDSIYQTAHYMLTRRGGGWPLTMFLQPDGTPFFGGTYFPKQPRYNLPGFIGVMERVATFRLSNGEEIVKQNMSLLAAFEHMLPQALDNVEISDAPLETAYTVLRHTFDAVDGGFGAAPKFPHAGEIEFLLRRHAATKHDEPLTMAAFTLKKMANGGIYDHLGGGFARYSVDGQWNIPHFEKMLYDNGPLLRLYADAWLLTQDPQFKQVVAETAAWVMCDMQAPNGGFYSSIDADSEGEEGTFYVWDREQIKNILSVEEYAVFAPCYGLEGAPNFEGAHWHLRIVESLESVSKALGKSVEEAEKIIAPARKKLYAVREQREHPHRDEKILVSWNALMIKGLARAGAVFDQPEWRVSARRALDFIRQHMWRDGRLLATYKGAPDTDTQKVQATGKSQRGVGKAHLNAYLDDYAFLLDALLELMQTEFHADDLHFAQQLADVVLVQFEDNTSGGFFFTSHDHERLIHRPKPAHDNATPAGNHVAAFALQRLGHLIGEPRYLAAAERTIKLFYPEMAQSPSGFATLAAALAETLVPTQLIVLIDKNNKVREWQKQLTHLYMPMAMVLALPEKITGLAGVLDKPRADTVNAWVCQGVSCLPPISDLNHLVNTLKTGTIARLSNSF
ncbi:MAG: thioredoxin domain-containing protein [Burkholderiales bacterium]